MPNAADPAKIAIVEYLRGAAAIGVCWFHLTNPFPPGGVQQSGSWGWLGVAVFFVISGFVLPLSIWQRAGKSYGVADAVDFATRRLVRIEPPYLISVLLTLALWQLSTMAPGFRGVAPDVPLTTVLAHVVYLPGVLGLGWLQPVYWTLAYEFCFYAALAVGYPVLVRHPVRTLAALFIAYGLAVFSRPGILDAYAPLFVMGMAVFLNLRGLLSRIGTWCVVAAAAAAAGAVNAQIAAAGLATALAIAVGQSWRAGPRLHRAGLWAGAISYSLYITHVPVGGRVVNLLGRIVHTEAQRLGVALAALAVAVVFAALYWRWIERVFIRLARSARRSPAAQSA